MRHVLRALVKQGHPGALEMLGFAADTPIVVDQLTVEPDAIAIGRVRRDVSLARHGTRERHPGRHHAEAPVDGIAIGNAWSTVP